MVLEAQTDKRRYNLPDTDEVAVIILDETSEHTFRDIRMANRGAGGFTRINQNHPSYMPLHYTLLFPYSDPGWHWAMQLTLANDSSRIRTRLEQRMYYRYHLHTRNEQSVVLHHAERLFQQFLVDAFAVVD